MFIFGTTVEFSVLATPKFQIIYMTLGQRPRSNIFKISIMACDVNSSFIFDRGCSYLAYSLLMVCRLQLRLHITAMTLELLLLVLLTRVYIWHNGRL